MLDCKTCRFFVPGRYVRTGTCSKFVIYKGRGKLMYEWAESVRFRQNKCGPEGKFYIQKETSDAPKLDE